MMTTIGTIITVFTTIVLITSALYTYKQRKLIEEYSDLIKKNLLRSTLNYTFWFALLIGGILMMLESKVFLPVLLIGFMALTLQMGIKILGTWIAYQTMKGDDDEDMFFDAMVAGIRKTFIGEAILLTIIISIQVWLLSYGI